LEKPGQPPHPACPFYAFLKRVDKFNDLLACAARARGRLEIIPDDKHRAGNAIRDQPSNRRACYSGKNGKIARVNRKWEAASLDVRKEEKRLYERSRKTSFRGDGVTHRGSSKRRQMAPPFFRFVLFSRLGLRRGQDGTPCGRWSEQRTGVRQREVVHSRMRKVNWGVKSVPAIPFPVEEDESDDKENAREG